MISVCMATYNGERYIKEQIDTIMTQISDEDELIISDDGSTDKTIDIINRYKEQYSNIVLLDGPHRGVIKNFENALKCAKGDYIFLSDQDDIWLENKVETILNCFVAKKPSVVLHDAIIVNANGDTIDKSFFEHRGSHKGLIRNLVKNSYLGCCMAFEKPLLAKVLPIPERIEMHDWWIGMLGELYGNTCLLSDKLIKYRRHENNVSSFHHHGLPKMIFNRLYLSIELIKRWVKTHE